ncbi:hypothetical protein AABB24_007689 [Solanum stoloniferum]|uniref:Uncharacterized protein n=1 Tax=Solanum stoloniferum TaxID=62892 RepID=A0ABD2UQC7_9SOLN
MYEMQFLNIGGLQGNILTSIGVKQLSILGCYDELGISFFGLSQIIVSSHMYEMQLLNIGGLQDNILTSIGVKQLSILDCYDELGISFFVLSHMLIWSLLIWDWYLWIINLGCDKLEFRE